MKKGSSQSAPGADQGVAAGGPDQAAKLYTVNQYPDVQPAFTEAALRSLIFNAKPRHSSKGVLPGNGLAECGAILRVGKKILIDDHKFIGWVRKQSLPKA